MPDIKIITVVGARPQFIKVAAVSRAINAYNLSHPDRRIEERIVHTGQHYDHNMSQVFFDQLKIPRPAVNLEIGSGSLAQQTGGILQRLAEVLAAEKPDLVLVYGDTNSTLAGALAAAQLHIPVAHVESGLRSYNRRMPEEINRVVADCLSTLLFCPTPTAVSNLAKEGLTRNVFDVGDVMYDSVLFNITLAMQSSTILQQLKLQAGSYCLATVHRADNTDNPLHLRAILSAFEQLDKPVVFPLHPRTRKTLGQSLTGISDRVQVIDPVAYLDMLILEKNASMVLTDSGGVQKEAYWFNAPCVILREETEWVELVRSGASRLAGADPDRIVAAAKAFRNTTGPGISSETAGIYGDGHSADKTVAILADWAAK